ncbi:MAG: DUF4139 domain-containing protein [Rhodospirillaceae bacterium]|nr:DUF4139 domain-containing protein [Rhodospirillaceae bacterium]
MTKALLLTAAVFFALPAIAAEVNVPAAAGGADVTVYNNDLAMVRERRSFRLPATSAQLAFTGVSGRLQPETAFLDVTKGDPVKVIDQSFSFGLITPAALLAQSVGQEVSVITTNPATGKETTVRAKVLSAVDGPVLDIGGKIHTSVPGRIVYDSLPPGLRPTPTLLMNVTGGANKDADAEFSYLTGGLSWHADYVVQYDADAARMDLTAWATITNTTGVEFKDARLKLVAGDVNRAAPPPRPMRMMEAKTMAANAPAMADNVTEQSLDAHHLYTIGKAVTLANQESKQLSLFSGQGIAARRELVVRNEQPYIYSNAVHGQIPEIRADAEMVFKNDTAAKLGLPLPAGTVRVYGMDEQGAPRFMGESAIAHTAVGSEVRVKLGRDFDVPVIREQTTFVRASDTITVSAWKITVKNAKSKPVKVRLIEPMPESWEISRETLPHKSSNAGSVEWNLDVPAKGQAVLEYTVKSTF